MKTIDKASLEYAISREIGENELSHIGEYQKSFRAGVAFAQQWIPIERDKDGLTTQKQDDEFLNNVPFLVKSEYGIEVFECLSVDLEKEEFTHWRPINIK